MKKYNVILLFLCVLLLSSNALAKVALVTGLGHDKCTNPRVIQAQNLSLGGHCHYNIFLGIDEAMKDPRFHVKEENVEAYRDKMVNFKYCKLEDWPDGSSNHTEPYCVEQSPDPNIPCPDPCRHLSQMSEKGCVIDMDCVKNYETRRPSLHYLK